MRLIQAIKRKHFWLLLLLGMLVFASAVPDEAHAAITYQSAGAVDYSVANGTTVAPAYPASVAAGDLLVLIVGMKPSTANSGSVTTPAGWIPITSLTGAGGYGATLGADTGNTNVFTFYTVAVGGEAGTLTVTLSTNNVSWAQMYRLSNATMGWDVAGTTGSDTTAGNVSIAMSANPGVTAGDYILGGMVIPTDVSTPGQFSAEALSQAGVTFGAVTEISEPDSGNGNDIGGFTYRAPVNSGTASAAPTLTATAGGTTTNVRGPGVFIRIREVSFTPGPGRYAVATGDWNATATWSSSSCGGAAGASVPVAGAAVTICANRTVTLNANTASLGSLTIIGTLTIGNSTAARTLTVAGDITIAVTGTLNVANFTSTHSLVVGGNITNNGTLNLALDADSLCNTTFNKNGSQTVSGTGATTRFNRITLNMGTTNANILDITATNFSINPAAPTNFLTLTNGTFKFSTTGTITPFTAAPTISATRGFWLNNAGATVSSGNFDWTVSGTSDTARGLLKVSSGTFNLGTASVNNDLITGNFSDIVIEGGILNVGGVLDRAAVADNVRFNMSSGTLTVAAAGAPGNYPFRMEAAASFTMSGGTIVIRNDGGNNGYQNLATTNNVTGGTLQIGDGSTLAGQIMGINSTAPVGNLLINSANATARLQTNSLTVNGNVTIAAGIFDNPNNLNLALGGNWSRTGTFTPGTGTVTFNGSAAQGITGATTFYGLAVNSSSATANSDLTVNGNFTNTAGFNAGTTLTTFSGTALQTLTGATMFYDLTFNNAAGFTLNNDMTASNTLTLTNGVIATGFNNVLFYDSTSSCSVTRTSGRVNGWMRKRFTASQKVCDFEIGDNTNYTPVNVDFSTAVTFTGGTVAAKAKATVPAVDHPEIATAPLDAANLVNRYWMLTPGGGLTFSDVTLTFTPIGGSPVDHDSTANVGNYTTQRYEISGGACDPDDTVNYTGAGSWNGTTETGTQTTTSIATTGIGTFGSICSHFVIGVSSISGFLYEKEFIYTREVYY